MKQQALEVFRIFEKVHGAVSAKTIVEYLENTDTMAIQREINARIEQLATKNDVFLVKKDLMTTREELLKEIAASKVELRAEMADLKTELRAEMADLKTELKTDMADLKTEFKSDMAKLRTELKADMADLSSGLKTEMANLRVDVNKSVFVMGLVQFLAIVASVLAIVNYMLK